jgi:hypothetical protein
MRKAFVTAVALATAACADSPNATAPTYSTPLQVQTAQPSGIAKNHSTHLSGDEEPAIAGPIQPSESHAQGQAHFKFANDGQSFDYKLIASNISNIVQAHIHCGPAGQNGPIMIWLYPGPTANAALSPGAGPHNGVLAEGTVIGGPAGPAPAHVRTVASTNAFCPGGIADFDDVIDNIKRGNAYVNVHTRLAPPPAATNTGPGDFPGGEIRGQLQ